MLVLPRISLEHDEVVAGFEIDCHQLLASGRAACVLVDAGNAVIKPLAEYLEHHVEFRVTGVKCDGLNVSRPNREAVDVFGSGVSASGAVVGSVAGHRAATGDDTEDFGCRAACGVGCRGGCRVHGRVGRRIEFCGRGCGRRGCRCGHRGGLRR